MARRPTYSDEEKARVYVALVSNDWNVKRTARDVGLNPATVRRWRDEWQDTPPNISFIEPVVAGFLEDAKRVRGKALEELEKKISNAKPSELITVIGVLDDKITRASGLATSRTETVHSLPTPEAMRELMQGFLEGIVGAARYRQGEVIDVELVEQPKRVLPR